MENSYCYEKTKISNFVTTLLQENYFITLTI